MSRLHSIAFGSLVLLSACAPDTTAPSAPPEAATPDLSIVSDGATIFVHVSVSVFFGSFSFPFTVTGGKKVEDFTAFAGVGTQSGFQKFPKLRPGTYVVQQTGDVAGMTFQDIRCNSTANKGSGILNDLIDNATRTVTIHLEAKETDTCEFNYVQQL